MVEDVVRDVYRRFAEDDIEGFLKLCADDIEWIANGPPRWKSAAHFMALMAYVRHKLVGSDGVCFRPSFVTFE